MCTRTPVLRFSLPQTSSKSPTCRKLADPQQLAQLAETCVIDAQEQLEMVVLDKEVAEERAELGETEM